MGDHGVFSQPSGLLLNGLLPEKSASVSQALDTERWLQAEGLTAELIARIQPNPSSEDRRNAVANYVQRLIMKCLSCRVFTFGSVPLKTYLPDGDIDLTAFSDNENLKDTWATTVCGALENEEKSENAEFRVKEVKYIQAEVKLIKCLVENIVVDISFNQVGGLCTLCFLEEMDKVINRNHLFKRSIILIKAWCYYESRILGAHHGLISTYALETLVLYIFHVFNNSFAGPLEVLYRFLQFFSNFDWGNYCVSLWGPVPISSLPDMNAEPPRKDNGDLLFSKSFLDKCTAVYSVTPGVQENHIQPFLSKHFNVVDPLRTNNNLGRSVSKGNFFRIRTAFAFGAKRLARLLECPKDTITAEVKVFFTNTWKRDGTGVRPDVLNLDSRPLQPLESVPVDESNKLKSSTGVEKLENGVLHVGEEHLLETGQNFDYFISDIHGNNENVYRLNNFSAVTHLQSHISYKKQINSRSTDQPERSHSSSGSVPSDKSQKVLKPNYSSLNDQEEQGRFPFARTKSSPELMETSYDLSRGRHGRAIETAKVQSTAKFDSSIRRKNMVSEITGSHSSKSPLDGYTSMRQASSQKNLDVSSNANSVVNCHQGDFGFTNMREELASVSETLEMQQEQQDLVNMMGSSNIHSFNGQVPFPMHVAPYHLPLTLSPVSTSMGYVKRNLARVLPSNLPLVGAPWGSNVQFAQSLTSFPLSHYFCAAPYSSNIDSAVESSNDGSASTELNLEDNDQGNWHEDNAVLSRGSNPGVSGLLDGKQQKIEGNLTSSPTARGTNSGSLSQVSNKLSREDRTSTREYLNSSFQSKTGRAGDVHSSLRSSKYFPPLQASSSRSKSTSENLRDRSAANKSPRDRWGRKPVPPPVSTSTYVKENSKLQFEASSDNVSTEVDDDNSGWIPLSTMGNDMPERITESTSLASPHMRNQHPPGYELAQNQSDSLIPLTPLLVGTSQQRAMDYSKLFTAFVPTGPPVPYLVFPTFGNFTPNTGNPDGYARQFDREEESDQFKLNSSDQNVDSVDSLDQSEAVMSPTVSRNSATESSEEPSSDILNSDLNGHRENLVYGRFCQNPYYHGSFMYSPSAVGSPLYFSGHYPWDGHVRSSAGNLNYTQITSPQLLPVMQLQSGADRASGVFQRSVDEAPRYRGGTGTYLPNPKASFRDRQSSSRNHRGNRHYDRNDPGDRQRFFDRSHGRNQAEKAGFRPDRPAAAKNQEDKRWDSYKHEPLASYQGVDHAFAASTNSSHNLDNAFGLYSQTTFSSNGGIPPDPQIPPVVLVYPFDQGVADGSSTEPPEFGSLRPVHPPIGNGAPRASDGITEGEPSDQRHSSYYRGGSTRSSPDQQPSSPHLEM